MHRFTLALSIATLPGFSATITHNLNVQIVQVFNDAGGDGAPIVFSGSGGGSYLYEAEVKKIWEQAGIQVTYLPVVSWNNTEAQRLTTSERGAIYGDTYTSATGDPLPDIPTDALQIFFVWDHPGTGYNGTSSTGWKNDAGFDPNTTAQNAGNAQLGIDGTFASNGRSVMANRGFVVEQLGGTLAHEIGHALGLRHVDSINMGAAAGTMEDPDFSEVPLTENNLMWSGGVGPNYNGTLDNDPNLTVLQENEFLRPEQITAAIINGLALDPDGNGTGVLQPIPEPSALLLSLVGLPALMRRRR